MYFGWHVVLQIGETMHFHRWTNNFTSISLWYPSSSMFTTYLRLWGALEILMCSDPRWAVAGQFSAGNLLVNSQVAETRGTSMGKAWARSQVGPLIPLPFVVLFQFLGGSIWKHALCLVHKVVGSSWAVPWIVSWSQAIGRGCQSSERTVYIFPGNWHGKHSVSSGQLVCF